MQHFTAQYKAGSLWYGCGGSSRQAQAEAMAWKHYDKHGGKVRVVDIGGNVVYEWERAKEVYGE